MATVVVNVITHFSKKVATANYFSFLFLFFVFVCLSWLFLFFLISFPCFPSPHQTLVSPSPLLPGRMNRRTRPT